MSRQLSREEARRILDSVDLPGSAATNLKLAFATKAERRESIVAKADEQEVKIAAAIEIQRVWRGYCTRCKLFGILHPNASIVPTDIGSRFMYTPSRLSDVRTVTPTAPRSSPQPLSKEPPTTVGGVSALGAASECVETADTEASEKRRIDNREEAAKVIQRSWRQHIDVQVYRYYRDLINFKSRGDPSSMLKCINPREAELLDAAAGVHIKFRLAGEKFPPNIYYKIFTHRNIVDMCANAPRDYTKATTKRLPVKYVHNKGKTTEEDDSSGWYQRWENNGWRLVSDRVMKHVDQDPVVYESTLKKEEFSHNKVVRRQDLQRKRKRKKVEWMKKMYKEGMLMARQGQDIETEHVLQSVAEGMLTITDTRGQDAVEDWEVDELLEWTNGLNFDQYLYDWKEVATSAGSEYQTEQTKFIPDDPFSLTLMSR